jgi:hypothetical protein
VCKSHSLLFGSLTSSWNFTAIRVGRRTVVRPRGRRVPKDGACRAWPECDLPLQMPMRSRTECSTNPLTDVLKSISFHGCPHVAQNYAMWRRSARSSLARRFAALSYREQQRRLPWRFELPPRPCSRGHLCLAMVRASSIEGAHRLTAPRESA